MKKVIIVLIVLMISQNEVLSQNRKQIDSLKEKYLGFQNVSMVSLLANPEKYQGKRVQIVGYLHLRREDGALYLSKHDADYLNSENAFWVNFADRVEKENLISEVNIELSYYDSKYVVIRGRFNQNNTGHLGSFAGGIESIDYIFESIQWYDGKDDIRTNK